MTEYGSAKCTEVIVGSVGPGQGGFPRRPAKRTGEPA
jgi:hypothetical protein